jgi:hypothetical protein
MASKTKRVDLPAGKPGEIAVNFGNVEALKLQLINEQNKLLRQAVPLLEKIDATLIRMEGKYDANQEQANG